jgi:hypothetical protein
MDARDVRTHVSSEGQASGRSSPESATIVRRPLLAAYAAQLAVGAYGGALGLVVGFLQLPANLEHRLPLGSPVVGAVALTILVALPATVVTVMAWRGHRYTLHAAVLDGTLLMGWIVVELAFIRDFSFLHPFYFGVGLGLVWWGRSTIGDITTRLRLGDVGIPPGDARDGAHR